MGEGQGERVWTVGHSNRSLEQLLEILRAHKIEAVADVRRWPMSHRNPQFNAGSFAAALAEAGIGYSHWPDLGGRREPLADSVNYGLRSEAFRGFADYMATQAFKDALALLIQTAAQQRTAIMCAEAVPWRCHRSLIADALVARGVEVLDIIDTGLARPHVFSPLARVEDGLVTYPSLV